MPSAWWHCSAQGISEACLVQQITDLIDLADSACRVLQARLFRLGPEPCNRKSDSSSMNFNLPGASSGGRLPTIDNSRWNGAHTRPDLAQVSHMRHGMHPPFINSQAQLPLGLAPHASHASQSTLSPPACVGCAHWVLAQTSHPS